MKGGAWGEDIIKYSTMIFAFLFGIGVAVLGIWTIFNVFRAGWSVGGPQTWSSLMGGNGNSNNSRRNGTRGRRGSNGNGNPKDNANAGIGLEAAPVPQPAPLNNGMEGFKLR